MNVKKYIETHKGLFAVAGIIAFFALEYILYRYVDRPVAHYARSLDIHAHGLIEFFRQMTDFGKGKWYLWPSGLIVIFFAFLSRGAGIPMPLRRLFGYTGVRAFYLFCTVALSGTLVNFFKPIIGRARPVLWLDHDIYGFQLFTLAGSLWNGMPSGHATTAFAVAFSLAKMYPRGWIVWYLYALLLTSSRIFVCAHYLSDVVAGAALAAITVWAFSRYGMNRLADVIFPIDKAPVSG